MFYKEYFFSTSIIISKHFTPKAPEEQWLVTWSQNPWKPCPNNTLITPKYHSCTGLEDRCSRAHIKNSTFAWLQTIVLLTVFIITMWETFVHTAKLPNWTMAEPFLIELFIFHKISIIYMLDCAESGGRVSCFSKWLRLFSCLPHRCMHFIFSFLYLFWSLDAVLVVY